MFSPDPIKSKGEAKEGEPPKENELVIYNFDSGSKDNFDVICNMVLVLPMEYDCVTKVSKSADCEEVEMERHRLVC